MATTWCMLVSPTTSNGERQSIVPKEWILPKCKKSAMSPLEALPKNGKPTELRPTSAITEATDRSIIRTTPANKVGGEYCCSSTPSSPFLP